MKTGGYNPPPNGGLDKSLGVPRHLFPFPQHSRRKRQVQRNRIRRQRLQLSAKFEEEKIAYPAAVKNSAKNSLISIVTRIAIRIQ